MVLLRKKINKQAEVESDVESFSLNTRSLTLTLFGVPKTLLPKYCSEDDFLSGPPDVQMNC